MIVAHCITFPDVLWLMATDGNSVDMTHLYKKTKSKKQKQENCYTATEQDTPKRGKYWTVGFQFSGEFCWWKVAFMNVTRRHKSLSNVHFEKIFAAMHRTTFYPQGAVKAHTGSFQVESHHHAI